MKLSVFTVMLPEFEPAEAAKLLAENGYQGVEWRIREVPKEPVQSTQAAFWSANKCTIDLDTLLEQAEAVRDLTVGAGLEMCNLATYLQASQIELVEMVMQAAQIMGAPSLRVGVPRYNRMTPYDELFADARESLAKVQKLAEKYKIKGLIELHMGNMTSSASAARRLLEPFDPEYIGAIYDPGNMMYEGYEQWRMGLEVLGEYLGHVHAKNTLWKPVGVNGHGAVQWQAEAAPMDAGMADWGLIIDDLKAVGYDGFVSFEDFSDLPTEAKLPRNAEFINKLLA
jgi:sugar phosphate isomerase/epimerase